MKRFFLISFISIIIISSVSAQGISFSYYLDSYYSYDFTEPVGNLRQYVTQAARHNEFNINLALIKASYEDEKFRANLALQTGTYPSVNYAEPTALAQMINEANVGVKIGNSSWIDVGVMGGHFGYESVFTLDNELYTQALATEYTPYYQTGIQYSNQINEEITVRAVILNGWQNIYENNDDKAAGLGVDYQLNDQIMISYGNFVGREPNFGNDIRFHNNVAASYSQDQLSGALSLDYTIEGQDNVLFITLIGKYQLNEKLSVGGRYEFVDDENGVLLGTNFNSNIITSSLNYHFAENIAFKTEAKLYFGNEPIWNVTNGSRYNNQVLSAGLAIRIE